MVSDVIVQKKTLEKLGSRQNETAAWKPSSFAVEHLKKLGWTEGNGLGKNQQGMVSHIKVQAKDDVKGIGFKQTTDLDFQNAWWSNGFEQTLANIKVPSATASDSDSSDSDDEDLDNDQKVSLMTRDLEQYSEADRKLFLACGGRRCGKRAGRLQTGKMLREAAADKLFAESMQKHAVVKGNEKVTTEFHLVAKQSVLNSTEKESSTTIWSETVKASLVVREEAEKIGLQSAGKSSDEKKKKKKEKKQKKRKGDSTSDMDSTSKVAKRKLDETQETDTVEKDKSKKRKKEKKEKKEKKSKGSV